MKANFNFPEDEFLATEIMQSLERGRKICVFRVLHKMLHWAISYCSHAVMARICTKK